ncbi:hypothetical protein KUV85_09085 [Nocardioides panacisoli]|uniref:Rv3235 family protein n=1 Tax=Nocardioides panacisoli TaxID=627624 RepID=UPI001C6314BF|nr:Rv3235 family protein [Nocardioides panacisoli]QYJ02493.1 hypothetical protein KUV85_09085 [Nocardioides panacisoli]
MMIDPADSTAAASSHDHWAVPVAETQGTLALALVPRQDPPRPRAGSGPMATVVPIDRRMRATVEEWARRFAQAAVEVVGGDRPVSQLLRWATDEVYADLQRRARVVARAGRHQPGLARVQPVRPRVVSVCSCFVRDDAVETAVHVKYGTRSRAVAARFERIRQRWVCVALEFS